MENGQHMYYPVKYKPPRQTSYWTVLLLIPLFLLIGLVGYGMMNRSSLFDTDDLQRPEGQPIQIGVGGGPPLIITPSPEIEDTTQLYGATPPAIEHEIFSE